MKNPAARWFFTREGGEIQFLLIQNRVGIYGFPKGHMEAGESEHKTARREISGGGRYGFAEARELFQFESSRRILWKANEFLLGK